MLFLVNKKSKIIVCADGGLYHAQKLSVRPHLLIGDFDSVQGEYDTGVETIRLSVKKDDTDTVAAVKEALNRGYRDFLFFGVTGGRLEHTLGNIYILEYLINYDATGKIIDDTSEIYLVKNGSISIKKGSGHYFSLIAINGVCRGVTIQGAMFPLSDAVIEPHYQYGISNEVTNEYATVEVKEGTLLVILS